MNYYERHIGDYLKDTSHLSLLEHGIYTRLLDVYYTRERAIPDDQVARLIGARSKDEKEALAVVLSDFFHLEDLGWTQGRCEAEISRYQKKAEHNRVVGKLGGRPRKTVTQTEPTNNPGGFQTEPTNNPPQTPDTSNQTPVTSNQTNTGHAVVVEEGDENHDSSVSRQAAVCMVIKAEGVGSVNPQHPELMALIEQGADVGNFAAAAKVAKSKGKGFAYLLGVVKGQMADAAKLANAQPAQATPGARPQTESFRERDSRLAAERIAEFMPGIAAKPQRNRSVIDITPVTPQSVFGVTV